jgi:F-type H+-transporting ATPase subunit k
MATLGTTFAGSWLALRGGDKPAQEQGPPLNAKSKEEESFIKYENPLYRARSGKEER